MRFDFFPFLLLATDNSNNNNIDDNDSNFGALYGGVSAAIIFSAILITACIVGVVVSYKVSRGFRRQKYVSRSTVASNQTTAVLASTVITNTKEIEMVDAPSWNTLPQAPPPDYSTLAEKSPPQPLVPAGSSQQQY